MSLQKKDLVPCALAAVTWILLVVLLPLPPAEAKAQRSLRPHCSSALIRSANHHRRIVVERHGNEAAGRNIVKDGRVHANQRVYRATCHEVSKYRDQLVVLHTVPKHVVYMARTASPPAQRPAGVQSPTMAPTGLASCIVHSESGGDPTATNGIYGGIAQWSPEAWARMGGTRYAPSPTGATYQQQLQVLGEGLKTYGCRDWCPYDPC